MTAKLRYTILNGHLSIQLFQNYGWLVLWYVGRYLAGMYVVQNKDSLFCIDFVDVTASNSSIFSISDFLSLPYWQP